MKYYFDVTETFIKTIAIEADSLEQAEKRIENAYENKEFKISREYPDHIDFKCAQEVVEECIRDGFIHESELETFSCNLNNEV